MDVRGSNGNLNKCRRNAYVQPRNIARLRGYSSLEYCVNKVRPQQVAEVQPNNGHSELISGFQVRNWASVMLNIGSITPPHESPDLWYALLLVIWGPGMEAHACLLDRIVGGTPLRWGDRAGPRSSWTKRRSRSRVSPRSPLVSSSKKRRRRRTSCNTVPKAWLDICACIFLRQW